MSNNDCSSLKKRIETKANETLVKPIDNSKRISITISDDLDSLVNDMELKKYQIDSVYSKIKSNYQMNIALAEERIELQERYETLKNELTTIIELINNI